MVLLKTEFLPETRFPLRVISGAENELALDFIDAPYQAIYTVLTVVLPLKMLGGGSTRVLLLAPRKVPSGGNHDEGFSTFCLGIGILPTACVAAAVRVAGGLRHPLSTTGTNYYTAAIRRNWDMDPDARGPILCAAGHGYGRYGNGHPAYADD